MLFSRVGVWVVAFVVSSSVAVPPYFWYATHSIENYYYQNGGCYYDLALAHNEADGFHNAVQGHSILNKWRRYNRRDSECTATRWRGESAEINGVDFLYFSGHGRSRGPLLGCGSTFDIVNWDDIRFHGGQHLKWVQASACEWFVPAHLDPDSTGRTALSRWNPCFNGVHTVQGHRAITYETNYTDEVSDSFFDKWVDQGYGIWVSWRDSQIYWVYQQGSAPGLEPSAVAATTEYGHETWANASDAPATPAILWITASTVGTPQY